VVNVVGLSPSAYCKLVCETEYDKRLIHRWLDVTLTLDGQEWYAARHAENAEVCPLFMVIPSNNLETTIERKIRYQTVSSACS